MNAGSRFPQTWRATPSFQWILLKVKIVNPAENQNGTNHWGLATSSLKFDKEHPFSVCCHNQLEHLAVVALFQGKLSRGPCPLGTVGSVDLG